MFLIGDKKKKDNDFTLPIKSQHTKCSAVLCTTTCGLRQTMIGLSDGGLSLKNFEQVFQPSKMTDYMNICSRDICSYNFSWYKREQNLKKHE